MKSFNTFLIERRKTKRDIPNNEEHELIHDDGSAQLYKLNTHAASRKIYGGGAHKGYPKTDWCTAGEDCSQFNTYSEGAPLYVIHSKDDRGNPQVHQFNDSPNDRSFVDAEDNDADFSEFIRKRPQLASKIKFTSPETEEEFNPSVHADRINYLQKTSKSNTSFLDNLSSNDNNHLISSPHLSQEHKNLIINSAHLKANNLLARSSSLSEEDAKNMLSKEYNTNDPIVHRDMMNNLLENSGLSKEYHNQLFNKFISHVKEHGLTEGVHILTLTGSKNFADEHANKLLDIDDIRNNVTKTSTLAANPVVNKNTITRILDSYKTNPHRDILYANILNNKNIDSGHLESIIQNTKNSRTISKATEQLEKLKKSEQ